MMMSIGATGRKKKNIAPKTNKKKLPGANLVYRTTP